LHGEATKSDYLDLKSEILMLSSIGLLCKHVLKESRMDDVYPCKGNFKYNALLVLCFVLLTELLTEKTAQ